MKIGIISDTHRNRALHESVLNLLLTFGVSKIYHLGDDYMDSELEIEYGLEVVRVPGLYCPEYREGTVDKVAYDTVQGVSVVLAHDFKDISESDRQCHDIVLYGHTHKQEMRVENGRLYLNPGHLKSDSDKGRPPSYATLAVDLGELEAAIREAATGKVIQRLHLRKDDSGLYKV